MKNGIKIIALLLIMVAATSAELKMGYVNSDLILTSYHGTKSAEEKLRQQYAKWENEATQKQQRIQGMQADLQKQALLMSETRKAEVEKELQDSLIAYQSFLQEKFGEQGEAARQNSELLQPIIEKISVILNDMAEKENYDFIFDSKAGIVFAKKGYDLTDKVLKILNSGK